MITWDVLGMGFTGFSSVVTWLTNVLGMVILHILNMFTWIFAYNHIVM